MKNETELWKDRENAPNEVKLVMSNTVFKNRSRGGTYYGSYTDKNGKRKQFSTGCHNKNLAQRRYTEHLQSVWNSENELKIRPCNLSEFSEEYLSVRRGERISKGQMKELRSSLTFLQRTIGDIPISRITVKDCEVFIARGWRPEGWPSLYTAKKHYQNLTHAFKCAVRWHYIRVNPFTDIKKPKPVVQPPEYLNAKDKVLFFDSLPEETMPERRFRNVFLLAINTGLRLGEIQNLERRDIDFQRYELYVRMKPTWTPKSRKSRAVPLSADAIIALRFQIAENSKSESENVRSSPYIFPNPQGKPLSPRVLETPFNVQARTLFPERDRLHFHSLRHTYGSFLCEQGVPLQEIQKIMGHSTIQMTEVYARLRDNNFTKALNALNSGPSMIRKSYSSHDDLLNEIATPLLRIES